MDGPGGSYDGRSWRGPSDGRSRGVPLMDSPGYPLMDGPGYPLMDSPRGAL